MATVNHKFSKKFLCAMLCLTLLIACIPMSITATADIAAFVNSASGKGHFTIANEITHDLGENYHIPDDMSFEIKVTLEGVGTANATFTASQTNSNITSITTDENGSFTASLKHGEEFELFDLPEGTIAKVVENTASNFGFTPTYWDSGELGDGVVTVKADNTVSVIIVNNYSPKEIYPVNLNVSGTQYFKNDDGTDVSDWGSYKFDIAIERYINGSWTRIDTVTVNQNNRNFAFDLSNERYTKPGTYSYQIYVIEPDDADKYTGVFYDNVWHTFTVTVSDAKMDGQLEIVSVNSAHTDKEFKPVNGVWNVDVSFNNIQYTTSPVTAVIDVQKILKNESNSSVVSLEGYTFGAYTDKECSSLVTNAVDGVYNVDMVSTDAVGEGWIDIIFNKAGTYTFYVKEINNGINNMTYSPQVVAVNIVVENATNGRLVANVTYDTATNNDGELEFTNIYNPDDAEFEFDFVTKSLSGRALNANEFTFEVRDLQGNTLLTGTNDANGKVSFSSTLKLSDIGSHYYNVVETSADKLGVTIEKVIYRVLVVVTDVNGQLTAVHRVLNTVRNAITFYSTYSAAEATYSVSGKLLLEDKDITENDFGFTLYESDINRSIGKEIETVYNSADGNFSFNGIRYDTADTYYYIVREVNGGEVIDGITRDDTSFHVCIEITDDLKGQLQSSVHIYYDENIQQESIVFVNTYDDAPDTPDDPEDSKDTGTTDNPSDDNTPGKPDNKDDTNKLSNSGTLTPGANTGDSTSLWIWFSLMFISVLGIIATGCLQQKKKNKRELNLE